MWPKTGSGCGSSRPPCRCEDKKKKSAAQPSSPLLDSLEESKPIYVAENGKRMRKQQTAVPVSSNRFKACMKSAAQPSSPLLDSLEESKPIYVAENGKRMRKQQTAVPVSSNRFKACIHGDQTVVTGSTVRMRLLEDVTVAGMKIPANTLFYGMATLGASRLDVVVSSLKVGDNINPVSFVIYDNDAMEGLNLPNNLKEREADAEAADRRAGEQQPV